MPFRWNDDLLLLSRLDAGRLPLQPADVDVPALLADVGRRAGRLAAARGVTLDVAAGLARGRRTQGARRAAPGCAAPKAHIPWHTDLQTSRARARLKSAPWWDLNSRETAHDATWHISWASVQRRRSSVSRTCGGMEDGACNGV